MKAYDTNCISSNEWWSHRVSTDSLSLKDCSLTRSHTLRSDIVRMSAVNRICWLVPPVWINTLVWKSCWTQAVCAILFCVFEGTWVYVRDDFPKECDTTQRGLLLGVLLLLPVTPLLESMILHRHKLAPTDVTPHWAKFPLAPPVCQQCLYIYLCVCAYCLPACQPD